MILRHHVTKLLVLAAALAAVMLSPSPAAAHSTDSLHRHGWTYVSASQITQCWNSSWDPYGGSSSVSVAAFWPDLVTSPVRIVNGVQYNYKVKLVSELQYWNGSAFVTAGGEPYKRYYTWANNNGMVGWWWEDGTDRYAPTKLSYDVVAGYYYRLRVWYQWTYDGTWHYDDTNWCQA
jgi:hypothetical protein